MAEPDLIRAYRATLDATLPAEIAEEVADGLEETYQRHLAAGLEPRAAERAALAEFGGAEAIAAAFAESSPARSTARILLGAGPVVGAWWAIALIRAHAWTWAIPAFVPLTIGPALAIVIALLVLAASCSGYRTSKRAAAAALIGLALLDVTLPGLLVLPGQLHGWPATVAASLSLSRAAFAATAWRRVNAA